MMNDLYPIITLIVAILVVAANSLLAVVVYKNNTKSATSRIFAALCVLTSAWLTVVYLSTLAQFSEISLWLIRINLFLAIPQVVMFFLLSHTLPHNKMRVGKKWLLSIGVLSSMVMFITLSPYTFTDIVFSGGVPNPVVGWGIVLFMLLAIGLSLATIITLILRVKKSKGIEKQQLLFVASGAALMLGLIILTILIPAVVFQNTIFVNAAPVYVLLFLVITSYAIIKHQLFDIRLLVARAVAYVLLITTLFSFYTVAIFAVSNLLNQGRAETEQIAIYAILAIFIGATFNPLKLYFDRITEKIFYKNRYSTNVLISQITKVMAETLKLEDLADSSLRRITSTIQINHGSFLVKSDKNFECASSIDHELRLSHGAQESLEILGQSNHIMISEEDTEDGHHKILKRLNATVAVPLYAGDMLQGILLLGPKKSGEIYTEKDVNVLSILAPSLAIAVDNARSYKQISEFNVTLEHEVEKATKELQVANSKLFKNNEKLRQLDELKDEFISVTSHELRTPLTSIKGYLWMAMHGKKRDDKFVDYMNKAYVSTERLITMVNDTLDVSRIESGRVELAIEPTNLNKLTQDVVDDLIDRANQFDQQLVLKKTRALPMVDCDPTKIYQVLTNLVGNALKFTPAGGKIKVDFSHRGNYVTVRVQDDGPGISASNQEKLFQKFSRLETTIPGTGLGLYLCMQIVRLSKGKIWIESKEGRGSAFLFTLPVSKSQDVKLTEHPQQFRNIA